jgi:hypothetical protein
MHFRPQQMEAMEGWCRRCSIEAPAPRPTVSLHQYWNSVRWHTLSSFWKIRSRRIFPEHLKSPVYLELHLLYSTSVASVSCCGYFGGPAVFIGPPRITQVPRNSSWASHVHFLIPQQPLDFQSKSFRPLTEQGVSRTERAKLDM